MSADMDDQHMRQLAASAAALVELRDVDELVFGLQRLVNLAQQALRGLVLEQSRSGRWAELGYTSPTAWLSRHSGLSRGVARSVLSQARHVEQMPATSVAAAEGLLNDQQIRLLTRCHAAAPERYDAEIDETLSGLDTVEELAVAVRLWLSAAADAKSTPEHTEHQPEKAHFHLSETLDGYWVCNGALSPQDGQLLNQVLDQYVDTAIRAKRDGDVSWDDMTIAAIRAQALVHLADGALRRQPSIHARCNRYRVKVNIRLNENGTITPEGPIPVEALCDMTLHRAIFGPEGELLDIGRASRHWPVATAEAIRDRDRHCTFPGCDRPPNWCDIHHCHHWQHGGETSHTNATLLCRWHHVFIHAKNWTVRLDQHQKPIYTKPDGTTHHLPNRRQRSR